MHGLTMALDGETLLCGSHLLFLQAAQKKDNGVRLVDLNGDGLVDLLEDYANGSTTTKGAWINNGNGWTLNNSWQSPEPFTKDGKNKGRRIGDVNGDGFGFFNSS